MTPADLSAILKTVPETRLRLLTLVWELVGDKGDFDATKVAFHQEELRLAATQAREYSQQVETLARRLVWLVHPRGS